ncbi:MAG: DUF1743 domain-containing protein [Desulfurococcales archaeon]|nr:DUF1743 domain-containing protein [Desulfurococcales archaeon]
MGQGNIVTIAFDDIDNRVGGCTTHFTTLFLLEASKHLESMLDYPILARLNPAIPWKTRGNAATALRIETRLGPEELLELASWMAEEYISGRPEATGKRPGIVVSEGEPWRDPRLRRIYREALTSIVSPSRVTRLLDKMGILYRGGRGVVGAAAATAALGPGDPYTFEVIGYRSPDTWSPGRRILWSVYSTSTWPSCTFNNVEWASLEASAAPGGADPVLAGVRGYCPFTDWCLSAGADVCVVFRSNQHTGVHHIPLTPQLTPYSVGYANAMIIGRPVQLPKGHTVVEAKVLNRSVDLAFFRETWPLNIVARGLREGDIVGVLAHVKPYTVNGKPVLAVELLDILQLRQDKAQANPRCPLCGSSMKSMGSKGGFKCPQCGYKSRMYSRVETWAPRGLAGGRYTVRPGRYPHLSPPPITAKAPVIRLPLRLDINQILYTGGFTPP